MSSQISSLSSQKRKLEVDIQGLHTDYEDLHSEMRGADDRAKSAIAESSRLSNELRSEKSHSIQIEKIRKTLEIQIKEVTIQLEEAEVSGSKSGKKAVAKLENRVHELESELDNEQRRHAETQKNMRKADRRLKELAFQADEDRKNQERLTELCTSLQMKVTTFKRQVEEAVSTHSSHFIDQ